MKRPDRYTLCFLLLVILGVVQIALTYDDLSQTWDEPAHIAAGMEWLQKGTYQIEHQHPPLARVFDALGLYLAGIRMDASSSEMYQQGNNLLFDGGNYFRNLTLARLGSLMFFVWATVVIWKWAKNSFGLAVAVSSIFLVCTLPPVLAHAGIATTDMGAATTLINALFILNLWVKNPCAKNSIFLGASTAAALLSKFSNVPFLIICGFIVVIFQILSWKMTANRSSEKPKFIQAAGVTIVVCFVGIWAGYRFSVAPLNQVAQHYSSDAKADSKNKLINFLAHIPLPATEFASGLLVVAEHNRDGQLAYLFGDTYMQGRWYFFPVAVALKTPIPFLILASLGTWMLARTVIRTKDLKTFVVPGCAIAVLAAGMAGNMNAGVRHILGMYLLLSIVAGVGASALLSFGKHDWSRRLLLAILLLSQLVSSVMAQPDYLPYYNILGGKHPEEIVLDTSDWGQDANRLAVAVRERGIRSLSVCYRGSADLDKLGLPERKQLIPYKVTGGWVAASLLCNKMGDWTPPYDQYSWLDRYEPYEIIGKSIRLYYIPISSTKP